MLRKNHIGAIGEFGLSENDVIDFYMRQFQEEVPGVIESQSNQLLDNDVLLIVAEFMDYETLFSFAKVSHGAKDIAATSLSKEELAFFKSNDGIHYRKLEKEKLELQPSFLLKLAGEHPVITAAIIASSIVAAAVALYIALPVVATAAFFGLAALTLLGMAASTKNNVPIFAMPLIALGAACVAPYFICEDRKEKIARLTSKQNDLVEGQAGPSMTRG